MKRGRHPNFGHYKEHPPSCPPLSSPIQLQLPPQSRIKRPQRRSKLRPPHASCDAPGCMIPRSTATGAATRTHHLAHHPWWRGHCHRHVRIRAEVAAATVMTGSGPLTPPSPQSRPSPTTILWPSQPGPPHTPPPGATVPPWTEEDGRTSAELAPSPPYSPRRRSSPPPPPLNAGALPGAVPRRRRRGRRDGIGAATSTVLAICG